MWGRASSFRFPYPHESRVDAQPTVWQMLVHYSPFFSSSTIPILTDPDQSHFRQVMMPVAITRRSSSSRLMTCPHSGHVWTLSHRFPPFESVGCAFIGSL